MEMNWIYICVCVEMEGNSIQKTKKEMEGNNHGRYGHKNLTKTNIKETNKIKSVTIFCIEETEPKSSTNQLNKRKNS